MSVETTIERITPERAEQMLKHNHGNRKPSRERVKMFIRLMETGLFKMNGETIKFARSGRLIDGQHRLLAIVATGLTVTIMVVTGLDDDVYPTLDRPRVRSAADVLEARGDVSGRTLAAAVAIVSAYENKVISANGWPRLETEEILRALDARPEIRRSMEVVGCHRNEVYARAPMVAAHYIFSRENAEAADEFIAALRTGVGLAEGEPVYHLRERLLRDRSAKAKINRAYAFALMIKAWNAHVEHRPLRYLRVRKGSTRVVNGGTEQVLAAEAFPRVGET